MKSKKILLFVIALIGTFMINIKGVFALDISVSDVKVNKKGGNISLGDTSFDDKNINSSIEFNDLNDYVIYQITLKNNDSEDYTIDSIKDNNTNENISVSYSYDDKKISSKGTQNVYVTLKYNKKLYNKDSISLNDLTFTLNLLDSNGNSNSTIINPITGDSVTHYILLFIISLILIFFGLLLIKRRKSKLFLVFLIALIPSVVFAKKNLSISIRFTNITIKGEMLPYTVSIKDSNGNSTERTVIYGQPVGNLPEVSKVGYTFDKYEDQDGNKITEDTIVKGNLTVTPKFNPITYDITYDYAGGNASNPEHYTIEDDITLSQPTRNGYTFLGWTGTNINTVQNSVRIQNSTGNLNFVAHWSTNQNTPYRVIHKYQKLDGTYEEVVQNLEGPTDEEVTVALLNRDGFTGPQQLTSITIVAVENEEDIPTVTYTYTRNNYSLTLNDDIETTFTKPSYPYGTEITLTAKDKDNYEFIKWSNGETTKTITFSITGNTEIYPIYSRIKYTVTYDPMDGEISPTSQEVNAGESITTLPIPTAPTGKSFDGWYTEETGGNKVNDGYTPTGDITLYARYSVQSYTVSFNTNGGSNVPSQTIEYGGKVTRPTTNPTKKNYIFVNWYTDDSYNTVFDFDNTTITSNTIVYAKFKQDTFPVVFSEPGECTFNGSDGVLTGTNCSYANGTNKYIDTGINLYNTSNHDKDYEIGFTIVSYDYSENVTQATFMNTKLEGNNYPGLVFRKNDNGDKSLLDLSSRKTSSGNERKTFNYSDEIKVKIYRIYNEDLDTQEIFYSIDDGDKAKINDLSQFNPIFNLSVWFGAAPTNASATSAQRILVGTMKDMYIKLGTYEEDNSEKYIVTFNANGGSVTPTSKRIDIDSPIGTLPTPSAPTGKTFIGWYTELNGGEAVTSSYMPNTNKTIYARYYKDVTGATVSPSSISILNGASETLSISNVEEEYTFSSNNTNVATVDSTGKVTGTGVGTTTITITGSSSGKTKTVNVTVESSTYTVTLNPNGGTLTTTSITQNKGTAIGELPTPTAPSGKTFIGWYTELNGGEAVTSSYMPNTNKTIYARYYKDVTGATVSPSSISILNGASETLSISNVEEEYTFSSNNTNVATVDSTGKVTGTGVGTTTITITGSSSGKTKTVNVTVESSTYTVTLNPNGGTLTTTSITQNKGTAIGELPTPTAPTGKEFDGWYTGIDIGEKVTSSYMPNSNVTIYARYVDDPCKTFATDSWSTIRDNLESNSSYYAVGCEKEVEMDMDDDGTNESYTVRLANTSTPEVCSTEGYSQTACGFVIEFVDIVTKRKMKNSTGGNAGGWKETTMVDYLNSDFYNKLPNNLQSVIIPTYPIISGSGSGGKSNDITSDDINKDKVFLLAAKEINANTSNDNKSYKTKTLDYYKSHNSNTYRDKYDLLGESKTWWLRTADKNSSYGFIAIKMNAQLVESSMANSILGVAPAFRIGTMPSFTVTFDTDEGSSVTPQTITYGEKATKPTNDPTKTGLTFDNWYTDDTYTTVFDFDNTVITSNTTIYAHFIDPCNGFSTDSWSTIRDNLENDSSYYAVGCEKEVEMDINNDGTNESYTVRLANTSTPEACETEGYSQTACGTVIEFANIITTHRMNPYANCSENGNCNKGGWEYSDMRAYLNNTIYEAGNINYSTIGIYNALPSELKNTIIDTTVVSGHGTNDSANFITSDKLYLLSSVEVWGSPYDDTVTTALTRQLDYYEDLGVTTSNYSSTLKRLNNGANYWWLRSAGSNDNYSFSIVTFNNPSNSYLCNYEFAVSPAFRIGTNN